MQDLELLIVPLLVGGALGLAALGLGAYRARRTVAEARDDAARTLSEAEQEGENRRKEMLVSGQEKALQLDEEYDRRDRELEEREGRIEKRTSEVEREASEQGRRRKELARKEAAAEGHELATREAQEQARTLQRQARETLEHIAGLSVEEARAQLIAEIEAQARQEGERVARKIEDEAQENAERRAANLLIQASQRVNIRDAAESTVSFIELPSDEMKGRIIGKEGRNIRSLEMATGIDLVVDDTPRSILISSFDPIRREVARVSIDRLVEDGRIHPARIEEVVETVRAEIDDLVEERGVEAALGLGISDLHPKVARLVGRMRYHTNHGHNLQQHCLETAMIAGFMADETGARSDVVRRAGLLHEVGRIDDSSTDHPILSSAELCAKYGESDDVVQTIRHLHQDEKNKSLEALLVAAANRLSDQRPGARKENLAVFVERLRRLEGIAKRFDGINEAYAIKAGKEIRVIVDTTKATDKNAHELAKQIARAVEKELNYPGQIKVNVVRTTRAVRYAV